MKINKNNQSGLSDDDLLRYNKHILLPEIDIDGQHKLLNKHVMLIGLGGLGCPIDYYLASSGLGKITLIDKDIVDITNLQRQILFSSNDVGRKKIDVAHDRLTALNPSITIKKSDLYIDNNVTPKIFDDVDIIIDATDNFETRSIINKLTLKSKKP